MRPGFWIAPEGDGEAPALLPMPMVETGRLVETGGMVDASHMAGTGARNSGTGGPAFLATADADALIHACPRVAVLLPELAAALEAQSAEAPGRRFDVTSFNADERRLLGEVLGEGEVAATAALPGGVLARIGESVLAGLWRVRFESAGGQHLADYVEVAAVPQAVRQAAALAAPSIAPGLRAGGATPAVATDADAKDDATTPEGTMNVMPVLAEIAERMARWQPGQPSHVVNFSLLPMTDADMACLQGCLGSGAVELVARGYGRCRVQATGARHVWSVQYSNAAGQVVLDTMEIGDVPAAVLAADEDFRDSAARLRDIAAAWFA